MTRPDFIPDALFFIGAVVLLAFTVSDQWNKPDEFGPKTSLSKNQQSILSNIKFGPLNPPHGKPGHQCKVPVGAPLNAPAAAATASPDSARLSLRNLGNQPQFLNTPAPANSLPAATAPGLNPAHGQPGHRCDLALGAPLNSAPATQPATSAVSVRPKNNPAHGQPYHRCDIAIGVPLNSKPGTTTASNPSSRINSAAVKPDTTATPAYTYDSTGARLNPAHGLPGHDCNVTVGKPLKD